MHVAACQLIIAPLNFFYICIKSLETFSWQSIIMEMRRHAPDVLDFFATIAVPQIKKDSEQQIPPLCTAYGILMHSRWKELSLIQKLNRILLGFGNATGRVFICCLVWLFLVVFWSQMTCYSWRKVTIQKLFLMMP